MRNAYFNSNLAIFSFNVNVWTDVLLRYLETRDVRCFPSCKGNNGRRPLMSATFYSVALDRYFNLYVQTIVSITEIMMTVILLFIPVVIHAVAETEV